MDINGLQEQLAALAGRYDVVGASVAVGIGDDTYLATTGVLNRRTNTPVDTESVFQIGSITKVWTATLAMQLVDDGLLDLDLPLTTYLPDFRVADDEITNGVTTRHLLNHTSGIDGDFFLDTGRGDECVARYVAQMSDLRASHPLGATMSYSNAAFVVVGRLIEVLRGATWDEVLRERLVVPLGLEAAGTLPEEALLWGAATGHLAGEVTPQWGLPRSIGPAGLIHARAADVLTFVRMHLAGGLTASGQRVLSSAAATQMQDPRVTIPEPWTSGSNVGLGWLLSDWGRPVFGHDGETLGQNAYLRVAPGPTPVSMVLLTNGGHSEQLYAELFGEIFAEYADITMPAQPAPPSEPLTADHGDVLGVYERMAMSFRVEERDDELLLVARPSGVLATALGTDELRAPLVPFAPSAYLTQIPGEVGWLPVVFYTLEDGSAYLHLGTRAALRVGREAT